MSAGRAAPATSLELPGPFTLESGAGCHPSPWPTGPGAGETEDGDNAVLVCHALTGSADVDRWWARLFGPGRALDPERDFVVCSNVLGSCYGTTGPTSPHPAARRAWGGRLPRRSPSATWCGSRRALCDALGVRQLALVIGGSLGGMQVLEWALLFPDRVERSRRSPSRRATRPGASGSPRRNARRSSPTRAGAADTTPPATAPRPGSPPRGMIAMCTYRSQASFEARFGRRGRAGGPFAIESYLRHQGAQLVDRFDANTYVALTRAMDTHDVARGRGGCEAVLLRSAPGARRHDRHRRALPAGGAAGAGRRLPAARLATLSSPHGHDAFLIEGEATNALLSGFRAAIERGSQGNGREEGTWVA